MTGSLPSLHSVMYARFFVDGFIDVIAFMWPWCITKNVHRSPGGKDPKADIIHRAVDNM
jgi:hypothetical protein